MSINRIIDVNFIRGEFVKEGYTLLSSVYKNAFQKLDYVCSEGHNGSIRWNNWQQGQRCRKCAVNYRASKRRHSIEFVRSKFVAEGYELLSDNYSNNSQKLKYRCPKGHVKSITWADWNRGVRCSMCRGNVKLTYEFVKNSIESEGYKLLSTSYVNSKTKLKCVCSNGHVYYTRWCNWSFGYRCGKCAGNVKCDINSIRDSFSSEGYTLITTEYINQRQLLEFICPAGHKKSIRWNNWRQGQRCSVCAGVSKLSYNSVKKSFEDEGYILLTPDYKNSSQKLEYICPEGHKNSSIFSSWRKGHRCRDCAFMAQMGSGNSNWKGGISCDPYCFVWSDPEYKQSIKDRDNNVCQNPDCWKKAGKAAVLTLHHVDYDKKNCGPDNLITLCRSCNSRANKNRDLHKEFYRSILIEKYGYTY